MRTRQRLEMVRLPPGATNFPFHSHAAEWEFYLIISGQGKMRTRRKTTPLKPGDCVLHPPGEAHHMVNTGHEDLALRVERSDSTLRQTRPTDSGFWGQCACGSFHVHLILAFWICFALQLEMNALNTVWDLFLKLPYKDGGQALNTWNIAGLKTAVRLDGTLNDPRDTDKSWSVELALPWTALAEYAHRPSPPRDGDRWRVNFSRVAWDHRIVDWTILKDGPGTRARGRGDTSSPGSGLCSPELPPGNSR